MGRVEGKVALITGAARGQGRSHAVRLAEEGADIIALDACVDYGTVSYPMGTEEDLAETVRLVENLDRRIHAQKADVRDFEQVAQAVNAGLEVFDHIDIVSANAGIATRFAPIQDLTLDEWADTINTNLTGVMHTARAVVPSMIKAGRGGSIILTSSLLGAKGFANGACYVSAKHGVVGLTKTLANELGQYRIRANCLLPTNVDTPMIHNPDVYALFRPDIEGPVTKEQFIEAATPQNVIPIPYIEPIDISNAILWLASDEARYVTGVSLPIDAGAVIK